MPEICILTKKSASFEIHEELYLRIDSSEVLNGKEVISLIHEGPLSAILPD